MAIHIPERQRSEMGWRRLWEYKQDMRSAARSLKQRRPNSAAVPVFSKVRQGCNLGVSNALSRLCETQRRYISNLGMYRREL